MKKDTSKTEDSGLRRISELRNLGPACERDLNVVGIYTLNDIRRWGVEGTFVRMMEGRIAGGKGGKCCNASYLYALWGAVENCDWRDVPEAKKAEFKCLTARLRKQNCG